MIEFNGTFFIQLANFLVTLIALQFLLIKPVREQIASRKALTEGYLGDVEHFTQLAKEKISSYKSSLDHARQEAAVHRDALKDAGRQREQAVLAEAQAEAQEYIRQSRDNAAQQVKAAYADLQKQVPAYADQVVSKIIG